MNVFGLRQRLVAEYADSTRSLMTVGDSRIRELIEQERERGLARPEPMVQLNPAFEPGEWIDELVPARVLHRVCRRIFRKPSSSRPRSAPPAPSPRGGRSQDCQERSRLPVHSRAACSQPDGVLGPRDTDGCLITPPPVPRPPDESAIGRASLG